jgi:hypothetical protein
MRTLILRVINVLAIDVFSQTQCQKKTEANKIISLFFQKHIENVLQKKRKMRKREKAIKFPRHMLKKLNDEEKSS